MPSRAGRRERERKRERGTFLRACHARVVGNRMESYCYYRPSGSTTCLLFASFVVGFSFSSEDNTGCGDSGEGLSLREGFIAIVAFRVSNKKFWRRLD